ncbi:hypothetical protein, partial [Klebsiella pneumoniae]|uniref:hypothetical protein n=1 Tax=Klebsiella pneumoniae TaxID=573 RepID=UPI0019D7108D
HKCFKCGKQGHAIVLAPRKMFVMKSTPRASTIEAPKEDAHCKGSSLSYAWGKVREHDAFILFDPLTLALLTTSYQWSWPPSWAFKLLRWEIL